MTAESRAIVEVLTTVDAEPKRYVAVKIKLEEISKSLKVSVQS